MNKKHLRTLVYSLILILIFEGIIRKLMPGSLSKFMILAKDVICVGIMAGTFNIRFKQGLLRDIKNYLTVFVVCLIPLIISTAIKDPILAVYGTKQYVLYPWAMFGFVCAFQNYSSRDFVFPLRIVVLLLFPLTGLAIIQIFLPDSHWLNLSVTGTDMSAFKAGGRLRVSSTFPFVAQFCYYLTFAFPLLWVTSTFQKGPSKGFLGKFEKLHLIVPVFVIGNAITGSRVSVISNILILFVATGLLVIRGKTKNIGKIIGVSLGLVIAIAAARFIVPEAFEAFDARTSDSAIIDNEELSGRAHGILFRWWEVYKRHDPGIMGFGIGTMSNGVQSFSGYAADIRKRVWGETDLTNTVLEGGLYFVVIWMSFRVMVIVSCFKLYLKIRSPKLMFAAAFTMGYILLNGITQTLGIQPPLAIWWWLAIGIIIHLHRFELYMLRARKLQKKPKPLKKPPPPKPGARRSLGNLKQA